MSSDRKKEFNETPAFSDFKIRTRLSMNPFLKFLENTPEDTEISRTCRSADICNLLEADSDVLTPLSTEELLEKRPVLVQRLMGMIFSPVTWETDIAGAVEPFTLKPFYVSPLFRERLLEGDRFRGRWKIGKSDFNRGRLTRAYLMIIEKLLGVGHMLHDSITHIVCDPETGLERYYKINLDMRFVDVLPLRRVGPFTAEQREFILKHCYEPDVLKELLPPDAFELQGFTVLNVMDVTESEVLASLERDLIDQESVISQAGFARLQDRLRTLFNRPELVAGLAAVQEDQVLLISADKELTHNCIFRDSRHMPISHFKGTVFEKALLEKQIIVVRDALEDPANQRFYDEGTPVTLRSALIAPLIFQGKSIGALFVKAPNPAEFGLSETLTIQLIQPIFAMAVHRSLEDLDHHVQAVIKEKCTAIHPAVEWQFRKNVIHFLDNLRTRGNGEIEPIVFRGIYPLFGQSDIRGSTSARNMATQKDLSEHLHLALNVIQKAGNNGSLLILRELAGRIITSLEQLETGIGSGDEFSIIQFLNREVEPLFRPLEAFHPEVRQAVETYRDSIDDNLGTVYRLRREFEESVSVLNGRLADFLDREEAEMQALCPHYFERRRTDGVDYMIYMGEALLEDGEFNDLYLSNMRLWQLHIGCGMVWHTHHLKSSLRTPLDTAHLILVQNTPLSLRFRFDEKRFGVDGAYDTKHEIIKSRIDKAVIKGTGERLTQPGKIAIVYTQPDEAREMSLHIDFMRSEGFLTGETEKLELGDLPGVQGLRALRVRVDLESEELKKRMRDFGSSSSVPLEF